MPNAVVNGSPRWMARSPGLSSPSRARSPAVSMRWHDSGEPSQPRRATASRSRSPGSRLGDEAADALRGRDRGGLHGGQLLDLVDDAQAVGRVDEQVGRVLDPPAAPRPARAAASTRKLGASRVARSANGFQATTPTRRPSTTPSSPRIVGQRPGAVARLGRQGQVLVQLDGASASGAARGHPVALVAGQDERVAVRGDDEDRLLEARVEAGQARQVGAVLAVGVDHDPVVAALGHPGAQPLEPLRVARRRAPPASSPGARTSGRSTGASRAVRAAMSPPLDRRVGWSRIGRPRRAATGRPSPSGQVTRTSALVAGPSPTWIGPRVPLACPPPTVRSRSSTSSPTRTRQPRPDGVAVRAGLLEVDAEPVARPGRRPRAPRCATPGPARGGRPRRGRAGRRGPGRRRPPHGPGPCRPSRTPRSRSLNVPSGWPRNRSLGSSIA